MRKSGFKPKTLEQVKEAQRKKRESLKHAPRTPKLAPKGKKTKKPTKTARGKKMALKKRICEQYDLPTIPCSRWGTGKAPTRTEILRGMAWFVFSLHIRQRDVGKPCITCGLPLEAGDIQAGHYIPVGNSSIDMHFREDNVHGEHPVCNADFQGWHLVPMRKNMVNLYGEEHINKMDKLAGMKTTNKKDEQYFVDIIRKYM